MERSHVEGMERIAAELEDGDRLIAAAELRRILADQEDGPCDACGGSGEYRYGHSPERCVACNGRGTADRPALMATAPIESCDACGGSGECGYGCTEPDGSAEPCVECNGRGTFDPSAPFDSLIDEAGRAGR